MSRTIVIGLFLTGVAGLALLTLLAHRRRSRKVPPFSDLAGFVMSYEVARVPLGRVAVLGFWWWVGWHFFAR